nr:hypothetical protein [Tanacetum cinerariifolium]
DDVLPSPDNEDEVFNPGIISHEKSVKIITHFTQEKKLAVSYASWLFEDFDPPFSELLVFKEVPNSMRLLPFSSENEEKVFKPGIYTFKKFHCCFLSELSHPSFPVFKINMIFLSLMKIFHVQSGKNTPFLDEKSEAVTVDRGRKTKENAKRRAENADTVKVYSSFKERKKKEGLEVQLLERSKWRAIAANIVKM